MFSVVKRMWPRGRKRKMEVSGAIISSPFLSFLRVFFVSSPRAGLWASITEWESSWKRDLDLDCGEDVVVRQKEEDEDEQYDYLLTFLSLLVSIWSSNTVWENSKSCSHIM